MGSPTSKVGAAARHKERHACCVLDFALVFYSDPRGAFHTTLFWCLFWQVRPWHGGVPGPAVRQRRAAAGLCPRGGGGGRAVRAAHACSGAAAGRRRRGLRRPAHSLRPGAPQPCLCHVFTCSGMIKEVLPVIRVFLHLLWVSVLVT